MTKDPGHKEKLQNLINRAEYLIKTRGRFFTEGAKLAIHDMIQNACMTLEDTYQLPFVRSRRFYSPREDEAVHFATRRFTMTPSYKDDENEYTYYGLEPALAWFEKQDMMIGGRASLLTKSDLLIGKTEEILSTAVIGTEIGNYSAAACKEVTYAIEQIKKAITRSIGSDEELALAIVAGFNALRSFRFSRVLRTDVDPSATLYVTQEGLEGIIDNTKNDPLVKQQYNEIVSIADRYSLPYIEKTSQLMAEEWDYNEINKEFYLWSNTDKIINFIAPDQAVTASLAFVLPAVENEQDGFGHVWIDDLKLESASGNNPVIINSSFDEGVGSPDHWSPIARSGKPHMKWEGEYPYCGGGDRIYSKQSIEGKDHGLKHHSLYIGNPTSSDEGSWQYDSDIIIVSGSRYTISFAAKIEGKFKQGLKLILVFKDVDGCELDTFEYDFNRKSSLPNSCFLLTMQCDAIQYAFTKEMVYALKAKKEILYTLHDFCQGAEHWLIKQLRPDGSDSFGAVQGGRVLCSTAVTYSMIKNAGVFTEEEKAKFYAMVEYLMRYMLDLRDRTELTPEEAQRSCSNWQTDMCAGAAYMMLVLDDFPNRKAWLYNANMVLRSQLEWNVNSDHSWPESIRYHHAALERFSGYAKVLENVTGDNWFATTPLAGMFGFSLEMQTPGYTFFEGRIGTPPFGDHALGGGSEFSVFGTYMTDIAKINQTLASNMHHTWQLAGKPYKHYWGEAIAFENLLGKGTSYKPSSPLSLTSTQDYRDAGITIFRKGFGESHQSYFAIMSSPAPIGHGHLDQGSFIIYKNSVPIVMDSGIQGYFNSSTNWHLSSYSHACLQFATKQSAIQKQGNGYINLSAGTYSLERGWVDVPKTSRVLECEIGTNLETITIEIMNPEGTGKHIRQVWYWKESDLYVIRDTVVDYDGQVLFSLPVVSHHSVIEEKRVYSKGVYGVDLETVFISKVKDVWLEKGRSTPICENEHESDVCMMDYIRATADAKDGFLTLLYPKNREARRLQVSSEDGLTLRITVEDKIIVWSSPKSSYQEE